MNLACLDQGLETFDVRLAEGWELGVAAVEESRDRVAALDLGARLELAMEPGRAEILPAGLACFGAVLRRIGAERAHVSVRGLRHGLLEALALGES